MARKPSVAIIGSGFSGLAAAIALQQAGYDDFTIFERACGVGGVWRHNTYPGAACDVASSLYSFSFEPNPNWSRPFAPQPEIEAYLEHCVAKYGLTEHLRFDTEVVAVTFDETFDETSDETKASWTVETEAGVVERFDLVVAACGQLTRPSIPDLPGLDDFEGTYFHTAEFDHDHDLTGKRVAVVGNGATAVQLVPAIVDKVKSVTVFQRSAEYLLPKPDYQHLGVEHTLFRRLPLVGKAARAAWWTIGEYVNPALTLPMGRFRNAYLAPLAVAALAQLHAQVRDPELRAKLTPNYQLGCKRILLSSNYYPALTRDNADVVTDNITAIAPGGVVTADGTEHDVDTIIFATGFESHGFVAPIDVVGRDGRNLTEMWQGQPQAYLGMNVPGFPNFFLMYGPNTNFGGGSIVYILERQARYIVDAVRTLDRAGARFMDVKPAVFAAFSAEMQRRLAHSVWATGGCNSWYLDDSGKVTNNWAGLMSEYAFRTRKVDAKHYTFA